MCHHFGYVKNIKNCSGRKQLFVFYDSFNNFRGSAEMEKSPISFVMSSACSSFNGVPIGIISTKFVLFVENLLRKLETF